MSKTKYSNPAPGARGINLKDGTTVWIDAGDTLEVEADEVVHAHSDLKKGAAGEKAAAKAKEEGDTVQ